MKVKKLTFNLNHSIGIIYNTNNMESQSQPIRTNLKRKIKKGVPLKKNKGGGKKIEEIKMKTHHFSFRCLILTQSMEVDGIITLKSK